ncbi:MAG: hypothetical protein HN348_32530 [Proteobacteria bacterium]|nr:hypothetical protein [Pseudomonadota bacterium]
MAKATSRQWLWSSAILVIMAGASGCPHAPSTAITHQTDPIVITLTGCDVDSPPEKQCFVRLPSGKDIKATKAGSHKIELQEGAVLKCRTKQGMLLASFEWTSASIPLQPVTELSCFVGGVEVPFRILTTDALEENEKPKLMSRL